MRVMKNKRILLRSLCLKKIRMTKMMSKRRRYLNRISLGCVNNMTTLSMRKTFSLIVWILQILDSNPQLYQDQQHLQLCYIFLSILVYKLSEFVLFWINLPKISTVIITIKFGSKSRLKTGDSKNLERN